MKSIRGYLSFIVMFSLLFQLSAADAGLRITSVGCGGDVCLLGIYHYGKSGLVKYDGHSFHVIPAGDLKEPVVRIAWNGEYFLVAGEKGRLLEYDGHNLRDLTSQLGWGYGTQVLKFIPGGKRWLIYGASMANEETLSAVYDGERFSRAPKGLVWEIVPVGNGRFWFVCDNAVCEYSGREIREIADIPLSNVDFHRLYWNGKHLLLVGDYAQNGSWYSRLIAFDGTYFKKLNYPREPLTKIAWNGNYWVVNYYSENNYRFGKVYEDKFVEAGTVINTSTSALVCNGSYCLVSYRCRGVYGFDGEHFENLTESLREAGAECADKITWSGGFWLVLQQDSRGTVLLKYSGGAFEDLTPRLLEVLSEQSIAENKTAGISEQQKLIGAKYHFLAIGWNGSTWLIAGMIVPHTIAFMATYDGREFAPVAPPAGELWIESISWNGSEWIIKERGNVEGSKHRIYAYDGREFRVVGTWEEEAKKDVYKECNAEYCLIWNGSAQKLLKYSGGRYVDITRRSGIQVPHEGVVFMRWNGEYWLIGFGGTEGGGVIRYDGRNFARVRMPTPTAPSAIAWNGSVWLIGTLANPRFSGVLVRYDGYSTRSLTKEFLKSVVWKGGPMLKEPAGAKENLTGKGEPQPEKPVCGPTAVMLILAAVLLLRGYPPSR
ncbi:MAG: hypothetical protein GXO66_08295 [Euryarchaeota archaeon]|nr:hypothetical protein [Euryarchaeota archaeon]